MPFAQAGDVSLHFEVRGSGSPLLFIPGLGADMNVFKRLIGELSERAQVIAFDPRGAGRSDKPDEPYSIEMMASDALAVMDEAGVEQAQILGISMGGRIAMSLVLDHPERSTRLILVSTGARTIPLPAWSCRRWLMELAPRLPIMGRVDSQPHYAHVRQREASRRFDCTKRLGEIHIPTLILHGRHDQIIPHQLAVELSEGIHGSQFESFRGGHLFFVTSERPHFLDDVFAFIQ